MSDRDSMRVRKGDMKIVLDGLRVRTTHFVDRDKVKPEVRARIAERIEYLQFLAMRVSDAHNWPPESFEDFRAARPAETKETQ